MQRKFKALAAFAAASALLTGVAAAASSPSVTTGGTSSRTDTSAVLHGTVNPNGAASRYGFEWGLTTSYGVLSSAKTLAAGTKSVNVTDSAPGLIPGTTYHYRILSSNNYGVVFGQDRTFKTAGNPPPTVATGPASQLSTTGALLSGIVNPNGEKTTYYFQYGVSAFYGFQTFAQTTSPATSPAIVVSSLSGLTPGTWFHYRLVAVHPVGPAEYGADQTFFTFPSPRPKPRVPVTVKPHRTSKRPFTFTTTGKVIPPAWIPQPQSCFEGVYVRYFLGKRQISFQEVQLQPNCTFAATTVFRHLPGRGKATRTVHLTMKVHFRGNPYVAPFDATPQTVALVG